MMIDFSRCRLPPFQHQREDVEWLVERLYAFIASEMRTGKTKIAIDAAQFLFEAGKISNVVVVTPAPVRDVWYDPHLGELAKHLWSNAPATVTEFHARVRTWVHENETNKPRLDWYITNFEFIRSKNRLKQLLAVCGPRTLLIGDESSFLKNYAAQQTKAFLQLRRKCGRVVLLNGTPIFHSPLDLFSQGNILSPSILDCPTVTYFKARYAIQTPILTHGGKPLMSQWNRPVLTIASWTNLDDLQRRFAPHTVRRLQADCLDLPPKLDPVTLTATLTKETWDLYREMRNQFIVWLSSNEVATSASAAVKSLRLAQITGGFVGGIEQALEPESNDIDALLEQLDLGPLTAVVESTKRTLEAGKSEEGTKEIGREKLDVLLWFIEQRLEADPNLHLVVWSRFRAEAFRAEREVKERFPQFETAVLLGGQKRQERLRALELLKPETTPVGPVFIAGIEGTGSFGIDMTASHTCVTMSSGYSPGRSAQTLDRVYGPQQKFPIAYFNIIAVGPKGQKTIDFDILKSRRTGENVAQRTIAAWVKALSEE